MEKHGRTRQATDDNIVQRMRFACWIKKATDILSEYVILIVFPWHNIYAKAPYSYYYTYTLCLVIINLCVVYSKHCAFKCELTFTIIVVSRSNRVLLLNKLQPFPVTIR